MKKVSPVIGAGLAKAKCVTSGFVRGKLLLDRCLTVPCYELANVQCLLPALHALSERHGHLMNGFFVSGILVAIQSVRSDADKYM